MAREKIQKIARTYRIPTTLVERLDSYAHANGVTVTAAVAIILTAGLNSMDQNQQSRKMG